MVLKITVDAEAKMIIYRWIDSLGWVLYQQTGFVNGRLPNAA